MVLHYAKLLFAGRTEPVLFRITEEVSRDLHAAIVDGAAGDRQFLAFERDDGGLVAVSQPDVQLLHFLWEEDASPSSDEERPHVAIYLRGREAPYVAHPEPDSAEELELIVTQLESGLAPDKFPFVAFLDEDGERVAIRCDQLLALTISPELLEDEEELEDDEEAFEPDDDPDDSSPLIQ